MLRRLALLAGLAGGALTSQLPEYAQQYTQRLGGAADELARVVADFDASAAAVGLSRDAALAELQGTAFLARRQADMRRTIAREDRLTAQATKLHQATALERLVTLSQEGDAELMRRTWEAYQPALPLTPEGLGFAVAGVLGAGGLVQGCGGLLRRRRRA